LSLDQVILEKTDEHYRFQATLHESEMLDWWIASFKDNIWDVEKNII
jgi:hypothetical protein